jgi:hypothetical protein
MQLNGIYFSHLMCNSLQRSLTNIWIRAGDMSSSGVSFTKWIRDNCWWNIWFNVPFTQLFHDITLTFTTVVSLKVAHYGHKAIFLSDNNEFFVFSGMGSTGILSSFEYITNLIAMIKYHLNIYYFLESNVKSIIWRHM